MQANTRKLVGSLTFAILLSGGLFAQQEGPGSQDQGIESSTQGNRSTRLTLRLRDRLLRDIVKSIRRKSGVNIIIDESIDDRVTVDLEDVEWRQALEIVAEAAGCVVVQAASNVLKVEKPPRVYFAFENADVQKVIDTIAKISGANIVVSPDVQGTITLRLRNIQWRDALEATAKTLGYAVVEEDRGILRIVPRYQLREQLETRVMRLKYIRPPSPYRAYIKSEYMKEKITGYDSIRPEKNFPILDALKAAVDQDGGTIQYDRVSNSIVARGTSPALDNLHNLILQLDTEPAQVFFDMKLVTTQNQELLDIGVDPGEDGWTVALSGAAVPSRLPFGVWQDLDDITPNGEPLDPTISPVPATTYGTLDFTGLTMSLRLFKQDSTSTITQAPKLVAMDNTEATIFVGETVRYAQTTASSNQSGGLTFSIAEAPQSPVQQGFQLMVIPHVIANSDKVMLTVIPEAEQLSGTSTTLPGFDEFNSGAGLNSVSILLPRVSASTIVTTMLIRSGETAVIGGLMQRTQVDSVRGIPGLMKIPVFKWLFQVKEKQDAVNNLIVFLTVRVIHDSDDISEAIREAMRRYRKQMGSEWAEIWPEDVLPPAAGEKDGCGDSA